MVNQIRTYSIIIALLILGTHAHTWYMMDTMQKHTNAQIEAVVLKVDAVSAKIDVLQADIKAVQAKLVEMDKGVIEKAWEGTKKGVSYVWQGTKNIAANSWNFVSYPFREHDTCYAEGVEVPCG